mgnify:CR=1 FL=1
MDKTPNAAPEHVDLEIDQPNCSSMYYDYCGMIDRHNRYRQDDLMIERKYGTHDWSMRVNHSLFAMCVVDAYLLRKACTGSTEPPNAFFWKLATEMIDQPVTRGDNTPAVGNVSPVVRPNQSVLISLIQASYDRALY